MNVDARFVWCSFIYVVCVCVCSRVVMPCARCLVLQVNYVVQEAIVVIKDIFRKYPNKYESIISTLCENLDTLDEPEARYWASPSTLVMLGWVNGVEAKVFIALHAVHLMLPYLNIITLIVR